MTRPQRIAVLPGDGIGPEVTAEAVRVLQAAARLGELPLELQTLPFGASARAEHGSVFPQETRTAVGRADAVLLGAVGDPMADHWPAEERPERGLLQLRQFLGTWANLRPARCIPALIDSSPLRPERIQGTDLLVVRELCGGIYFGEPRGERLGEHGQEAFDTLIYNEHEVRRIARLAFAAARERRGRLTSVDKANVLASSRLWRRVVVEVSEEFPDVELEHRYVDACAMALATSPRDFDVLLCGNLFGDILSDEAGVLTGSLGCLPSASLGDGIGLFEPVHGSAPDLAGQDRANPMGAILSAALLLRHGLGREDLASLVEEALASCLDQGLRTADIHTPGTTLVGTRALGGAILRALEPSASVGELAPRGGHATAP